MTNELQTKLEKGETLTPEEQKSVLSELEADFLKLKQENPQKYLEVTRGMTKIIADLNKKLREETQG